MGKYNLTAQCFEVLAPELRGVELRPVHAILDNLTFDKVVCMITCKPSYINTCIQSHAYHGKVFRNLDDSRGDLGCVRDTILLFYELSPWLGKFNGEEMLAELRYVPFYARDRTRPTLPLPHCLADGQRHSQVDFASRKYKEIEILIQCQFCFEYDYQSLDAFQGLLGQPAYQHTFKDAIGQFIAAKKEEVIHRLRKEVEMLYTQTFAECRSLAFNRALDPTFLSSLTDETHEAIVAVLGNVQDTLSGLPSGKTPAGLSRTFHMLARFFSSAAMIEAAQVVFKDELERRVEVVFSYLPENSAVSFEHYFAPNTPSPQKLQVESLLDTTARLNHFFWKERLQQHFSRRRQDLSVTAA